MASTPPVGWELRTNALPLSDLAAGGAGLVAAAAAQEVMTDRTPTSDSDVATDAAGGGAGPGTFARAATGGAGGAAAPAAAAVQRAPAPVGVPAPRAAGAAPRSLAAPGGAGAAMQAGGGLPAPGAPAAAPTLLTAPAAQVPSVDSVATGAGDTAGRVVVAAVRGVTGMPSARASWAAMAPRIRTACGRGAKLCVWGEAAVPGYPVWLGGGKAAEAMRAADAEGQRRLRSSYVAECLPVPAEAASGPWFPPASAGAAAEDSPSRVLADICDLARELGVTFIGGVVAREPRSVALQSAVLVVRPDGAVRLRPKAKASTWERAVFGDARPGSLSSGGCGPAAVVPSPAGDLVVSALAGEDSLQARLRAALHASHAELHVAVATGAWPREPGAADTAALARASAQFVALEGRQYVVVARNPVFGAEEADDDWYALAGPTGEPLSIFFGSGGEGVVAVVVDGGAAWDARATFDPAGCSLLPA